MPLPECTRIDADDLDSARRLKQQGWREVEILETWLGKPTWSHGLSEVAREEDIPMLREIAKSAFKYDRLHADPRVPDEVADKVKMDWIEEAVKDRDRFVFIDRKGMGFLAMKLDQGKATIDLIGVHPKRSGRGVALGLVERACGVFRVHTLRAGTQETNLPAKGLYRKLGLAVMRRQRTFHR